MLCNLFPKPSLYPVVLPNPGHRVAALAQVTHSDAKKGDGPVRDRPGESEQGRLQVRLADGFGAGKEVAEGLSPALLVVLGHDLQALGVRGRRLGVARRGVRAGRRSRMPAAWVPFRPRWPT